MGSKQSTHETTNSEYSGKCTLEEVKKWVCIYFICALISIIGSSIGYGIYLLVTNDGESNSIQHEIFKY